MKLIFFSLMVFGAFAIHGQNTIEGIVYDDLKQEAVQYAKIRVLNTHSGVVSNSDGYFQLIRVVHDSLMISHVMYPNITIDARYFEEHDTLFIHAKTQEIPEVTVIGAKDELYKLIVAARKKLSKHATTKSKAYLSLESYWDQVPLEMIQAYYNATVDANGLDELVLKNGRIGLSRHDDQYFVSLSTTKVILGNRLLQSKKNTLPIGPLQLPRSKLKKYYKIHFVSMENGLHQYHLIPDTSKTKEELLEAYLYINKEEQVIYRIELEKKGLDKIPFTPINETDRVDSCNLLLTYSFNTTSMGYQLDQVEMNYDFVYQSLADRKRIHSECIVLLYDEQSLFQLPKGIFQHPTITDYEKITYQPFNDFFWATNRLICPSKKAVENEHFFKQNGVLLNFDSLSRYNDVFTNKVLFWNRKRIFPHQINGEFAYNVDPTTLQDYHQLTTMSDHYQLEASIFLDQNRRGDSIHYLLKTIINLEESFYHLKKNKNTVCFLNVYFDLVEIHKRRLEQQLNEGHWTNKQVDSLYTSAMSTLEGELKQYLRQVGHGENEGELKRYINRVYEELGIDNALLIEEEEFQVRMNGTKLSGKNPIIESYSYGSTLIKLGRYEEALGVLKEAEKWGDEHPWLFYNIGVCYLKLGQKDDACAYFEKSREYGEQLEETVLNICSEQ